MTRNHSRLLLCAASLLFSVHAFADDAPFSPLELSTLQQHMYKNFATRDVVFNKFDEGRTITSHPGAILASPSNKGEGFSQDYQFHWMRDAGVTMRQVFSDYLRANSQHQDTTELGAELQNYINFERDAQQQFSNPGEHTLGQPKFNIDGTVWEGSWARPQNDGPALRALALCEMGRENMAYMHEVVPMIKLDLSYVMSEWKKPNYDLWEEVNDADHFFTKMMQKHSLTCGGNLLYFADHTTSQLYTDTSKAIKQSLDKHWNEKLGYITETPDQLNYKGGGLNSAVILAVLYGNSLSEAGYSPEWSVRDDRVMSTVAALRDTFAEEYSINQANLQDPPLIGRYPNDKYDGNMFQQGNPWVLTTAAMAEYYYSLAYVYKKLHLPIEVTKRNQHFFEQMSVHLPIGAKYEYDTPAFNYVVLSIIEEGDYYLKAVKRYQVCETDHGCLHFAEQIDAKTGKQTSAKDLTWGYVSILRAMDVRKKL